MSLRKLFKVAGSALPRRLFGQDQRLSGQGRHSRENRDLGFDEWGQAPSWDQEQQRTSTYRGRFGAAGRGRADRLAAAAFYGEKDFGLTEDPPLPPWFTGAVAGATLHGVDGPWAQFGRSSEPMSWRGLFSEYATEIRYMAEEMTSPAAVLHELWTWAVDERLKPGFDVDVYIEPDGRIGGGFSNSSPMQDRLPRRSRKPQPSWSGMLMNLPGGSPSSKKPGTAKRVANVPAGSCISKWIETHKERRNP